MKQPDQIWTVEELKMLRAETIEECARVAENARAGWTYKFIAIAIRALKDKPCGSK